MGSSQDTCHDLAFFRPFLLAFSSVDLPVVLSLLCCLPINDGSFSFRSTSRWSIGAQSRHRVPIFPVPCRVVSIWAPGAACSMSFILRSSFELLVQHIS